MLDVAIKEVEPNAKADIQLPDAVRSATERVTTKSGRGRLVRSWRIHNSVAIEMKDHLMLVEAPLNDGRTRAGDRAGEELAPGKPIRYVVNSHNHFDHSGGLRAAAAEGATIITLPGTSPISSARSPSRPRSIPTASRSRARSQIPGRRQQAGTERRHAPVEIHPIANSVHTDTFLMVTCRRRSC